MAEITLHLCLYIHNIIIISENIGSIVYTYTNIFWGDCIYTNFMNLHYIIDSRVKGLETDHMHSFALYIEPRAVNIAPFYTS